MANSSGASELEKLISNCEFENQQYVKLIEHEDYLIESMQNEIDSKEEETRRLQEAVSQLDEASKQCHKQYTINRDNVDSLKKTNSVLIEHVAAMNNKMEILDAKVEAESKEHSQHLQRYNDILDSYYKQYESLPLAQELKKQELMTEDISKKNEETETFIQITKQNLHQLQGDSDLFNMGTNEFIVTLAKMRADTLAIMEEIEKKRKELTDLQETILQNLEETSNRNNERNVQKLTEMHLVDAESSEGEEATMEICEQQKLGEIESAMISMIGERDDGDEAIEIDVTSPDQISLQFMEEQDTAQVTDSKQNTEDTDGQLNHNQHTKGTYTTSETVADDGKADRVDDITDDVGLQVRVSSQGSSQAVADKCGIQTYTSEHHSKGDQYNRTGLEAPQPPFVTYKATGKESVHIHLEKNSEEQKCKQQETVLSNQSLPARQNKVGHEMLQGHRPSPLRPNIVQTASPILQVQSPLLPKVSRPSGATGHGLSLRKPALPQITRPVPALHKPSLPRQAGGSLRLPVLQTPRPAILYPQQLSPLPVRMRADDSQSSPYAATHSPLQLTSCQIPKSQHLPHQLPVQGQKIPQQKIKLLTSSPVSTQTPATHLMQTELNCLTKRHTSPPKFGQMYAPKNPSPLAQENTLSSQKIPVPVQQNWSRPVVSVQSSPQVCKNVATPVEHSSPQVLKNVPTPVVHSSPQVYKKGATPVVHSSPQVYKNVATPVVHSSPQVYKNVATPVVHSSPQVAMEIDQLDKHNNSQIDVDSSLLDEHSSSQNDVEFVQSDVHSELQTDKDFGQADRYNSSQVGMELDQPDVHNTLMTTAQMPQSTDTYYMKVKGSSDDPSIDAVSPQSSPDEPVKTPEKDRVRSLSKDSLSPFDSEKHRQKLADMKKSPGQPEHLYSAPLKRVFAEIDGSSGNQHPNIVQPNVFGQDGTSNTNVIPFDGSGDHSSTSHSRGTKEVKIDGRNSPFYREQESAFQFFDSFVKQTGDNRAKSPESIFCFGTGDMSKGAKANSAGFSIFGSHNDDEISTGFSFSFGDNTPKQGDQSTTGNEGSFLSLFGEGGNEDQADSNSGFSFNFTSNEPKSPAFSFF